MEAVPRSATSNLKIPSQQSHPISLYIIALFLEVVPHHLCNYNNQCLIPWRIKLYNEEVRLFWLFEKNIQHFVSNDTYIPIFSAEMSPEH